MEVPEWIEDEARCLLEIEGEVREILHRRTPQAATVRASARAAPTITLTQREAWLLLRAALPIPIQGTRQAPRLARVLTALQAFSGTLFEANDPNRYPSPVDRTVAAGLALLEAVRAWLEVTRWTQMCQKAHIRWPFDQRGGGSITSLTRQQGVPERERLENTRDLADLAAASRRRQIPFCGRRSLRLERQADEALSRHQVRDLVSLANRLHDLPAGELPPRGPYLVIGGESLENRPIHRGQAVTPGTRVHADPAGPARP